MLTKKLEGNAACGAKFKRHYQPCYHHSTRIIVKFKTLDIKILLLLNDLETQKEGNPTGGSTAKISAKVQFGQMPYNPQKKSCQKLGLRVVQTHCLNSLYSLLDDDNT